MQPPPRFPLALLTLLSILCLRPFTSRASDTPESVNAMLKAGKEVAWIITGCTSTDGDLAVLFASRLKGTPPAAFPYLVSSNFGPGATEAVASHEGAQHAELDLCTTQNIIVSLKTKRVLGRIKPSEPDESDVHFPGYNHRSLEALWLPEQAGRRLVLLHYAGRWATRELLMIELSEKGLRQTSLANLLEPIATAHVKTSLKGRKDFTLDQFGIYYELKSVVPPKAKDKARPGSPITVIIEFTAQVPKSKTAPEINAAMTVRLEATAEKLSAKVLKIEPSAPPTDRG
jgi:predicted transcriptional regulator